MNPKTKLISAICDIIAEHQKTPIDRHVGMFLDIDSLIASEIREEKIKLLEGLLNGDIPFHSAILSKIRELREEGKEAGKV